MKSILIPTDFSENAWNAARYGLQLFDKEECTFYLLNTYTPAVASSRFIAASVDGEMLENSPQGYSKRGLQNFIKRIQQHFDNPKHKFKIISSFSFLADEIKEIIASHEIDLVVMGTKGASGIEEVFMGSNTVRIIKSVNNCPVLAVPQNFEFITPTEIAFATDFNRFYTKSELGPLLEMANAFKATIRIVHVQYKIMALTELQKFNLSMLRKYLKQAEHYVHTVSELSSISKSLEMFTKELDIHLLAMLNYQHSYMEKITREPVVKRLTFHTQIPLLVIPELGMDASSKKINREMLFSD